jgi:peptidoglycan/LPS O-acetylase OafA/YrhL
MLYLNKYFLPQLNIIRAVASLAVAIYHLGGKTLPFFNFGWLGVQMFFVLTGFVICWSLPQNYSFKQFPKFLAKRLIRIEPPYIFSIVLVLLITWVFNRNWGQISFSNTFLHFAYLNNFFNNEYLSPVYWTLGVEFQFYLLIGLIFPFLFQKKYTSILGLFLLNLITIYFTSTYTLISNYIPYFTIGILIYLYKKNIINTIETYSFLFLISVSIYFQFGIAELLATVLTASVILFVNRSTLVIDFLSKISFSLYLTHDIVGSKIVILIGNNFYPKSFLTKGFSFLIGLTITILFAYLFYLIIERRCISLSKKISYNFE